jgi:hypothetical protein
MTTTELIAQLEKLQRNLVYIRSFLKKDGVLSEPEEVKIYRDLEIAKRNLKDFLFASLPKILQALRVQEAAPDFVAAVTAEFNEKGAGGYALARLHDMRTALQQSNQEGE